MAITSTNMGLKIWNLLADLFNHNDLANNLAAIDVHDHSTGKGVQVSTGGLADGAVTSAKIADNTIASADLSAPLAQAASVNQVGQTVKGSTTIATSESRTNTAYGLMPTPDQVSNITLGTNGILRVYYSATYSESVSQAGRAAIFLNNGTTTTQLKMATGIPSGTVPQPIAAACGGLASFSPMYLSTFFGGLTMDNEGGDGSTVTTGQVVGFYPKNPTSMEVGGNVVQFWPDGSTKYGVLGGPLEIFAAAGTYTLSVQYKSSSGSVTVSNRVLRVQAISFA